MSNIMEKLKAEEAEAEKLMYGSEENPSEVEAPSTEEEGYEDAPEEESVEVAETPEKKPKRENWKKRFIGYKSSTDETLRKQRETIYEQEQRISELEARVEQLQAENVKLQQALPPEDEFKDVFTEDDVNLLGEEALEAMKKAARAVKPQVKSQDPEISELKREVAEWKAKEARRRELALQKDKEARDIELRERVKHLVPNYEEIDVEPAFGDYLQDLDEASGLVRFDLFKSAVDNFDVAGVARFYQSYAKSKAPRESFIEDHIMPEGDAPTADSPERNAKRRYHISEYVEFMDDVTKGHYKGREKEAQKLELMYDKAMVEGRIYE